MYALDELRAFGTRRVTLVTTDGATLDGRIAQDRLSERAAVLLFALEDEAGEPVVVPLEAVASVRER